VAVNHDELVAYCLAKPGATPDEPWDGDLVAKVGGKIFAFLGTDRLGVKCGRDADEAAELRHRYPDIVEVMAYIGRHGWNSVTVDGTIPVDELLELVDDSYAAVVAKLPKRLRPQSA
jgi:predicted DNA-binding protein (MmcQ/YjbR family)